MLVATEWLAVHLDDEEVAIVDMRWRGDGSARALYEEAHVPRASYLDWSTDIVDPDAPVAFMLAPPDRFAKAMEGRGIGDHTTVVAYADQMGSGPFRLWWGCRVYGHDNVHVLDGGFDAWMREGRPVSKEPPVTRSATWTPRSTRRYVARAEDVQYADGRADVVVLDSRPPEQFRGEAVWFEKGPIPADEDGVARTPRGDIRAGRIPGAINLPASELYRPDFRLKSPEEIRAAASGVGLTPGCSAIAYCGVGLSAAALVFGLHVAGFEDATLYDASWEEWGRDPHRLVARG
jgi:thiosulfate/3-mercaptopyruvate sulfurtransferase